MEDMLNSRNFLADKTPQIRRQGTGIGGPSVCRERAAVRGMLELADLSFVGFDGQTAEARGPREPSLVPWCMTVPWMPGRSLGSDRREEVDGAARPGSPISAAASEFESQG